MQLISLPGTATVITCTILFTTITLAPIPKSIAQELQRQIHSKNNSKELVDEVWQVINKEYIDGSFNGQDWKAVRREYLSRNYSSKQEAYAAIREMLKKLGDPRTRFMEPKEFKSIQVGESGELSGIGLTIGINEKTREMTIIKPIENTPAAKAGILANDILLEINGQSTARMDTNEAVRLLRGEPGTSVRLVIRRLSKQMEFKVTRAPVKIQSVEYSLKETPIGNIGYIRLKQFSADTVKETQNAIKKLENQQVAGYILDLRNNPGGLLNSTTEIARMWISKGKIVSTIGRDRKVESKEANGKALTNKPLTVLVDQETAAGTEILAAALQENSRAILIGSETFGSSTIQSIKPLADGSGLAVTVSR